MHQENNRPAILIRVFSVVSINAAVMFVLKELWEVDLE